MDMCVCATSCSSYITAIVNFWHEVICFIWPPELSVLKKPFIFIWITLIWYLPLESSVFAYSFGNLLAAKIIILLEKTDSNIIDIWVYMCEKYLLQTSMPEDIFLQNNF